MLFSSTIFIFLFLPLVLLAYWTVKPRSLRNLVLLFASLFFYAWGELQFTLLILASIAINYTIALAIESYHQKSQKKLLLTLGITANLGILFWFKYSTFFSQALDRFFSSIEAIAIPISSVHLPLGISFFTFQALSYLVDVYRNQVKANRNPIQIALYIALFPQLIAGPIVRYIEIAPQLIRRQVTVEQFASGIRRFAIGLGKKILIANTLAKPSDAIFGLETSQLTPSLTALAIACYSLQIYFDFSGYSDMAIGLGRLFGFDLPENFNYPYSARSLREFWQRWHISLSTWFRDYLYIPLGGNRRSPCRTYFNLTLVFLLCGLWHGANWTFIVWGLIHGAFLIVERLLDRVNLGIERFPGSIVYTWIVVGLAWVFFRSPNLEYAIDFLKIMFGTVELSPRQYSIQAYWNSEIAVTLVVGAIAALPIYPIAIQWYRQWRDRVSSTLPISQIVLSHCMASVEITAIASIFWASTAKIAAETYQPFIYFRF
ncbi:MBOAT family protein [Oxynema sp. CENA135]|uniref:MBOAT family O-acyltransferase n=1 Tax=Oxynema sp. CENA135 TaxID=984206 RepID=UPI00190B7054|nr:MBOAT family protein [Oxynema sp. CENA135]MBK4730419.1 MBOAT family protein [Oxynema sp. CENA135]